MNLICNIHAYIYYIIYIVIYVYIYSRYIYVQTHTRLSVKLKRWDHPHGKPACGRGRLFTDDDHDGFAVILAMLAKNISGWWFEPL